MKGWWLAISMCVVGLGLIFQANGAHASVEDLMYEKRQITKEEWFKLKAEHEREDAIVQQRPAIKRWYDKISIRGYV